MIKIEVDAYTAHEELRATSDFINELARISLVRQENQKAERNCKSEDTEPMRDREETMPTHGKSRIGLTPEKIPSRPVKIVAGQVRQVKISFENGSEIGGETEDKIPLPPTSIMHASSDAAAKKSQIVPEAKKVSSPPKSNESEERDSRGFLWNPEIHAETKATNKDGSWRYRRHVDKALIVEFEESQGGVPQPPDSVENDENNIPEPPEATAEVETYISLMKKIGAAKVANRITEVRLREIAIEFLSVPSFKDLNKQPPETIAEISAVIDAELII